MRASLCDECASTMLQDYGMRTEVLKRQLMARDCLLGCQWLVPKAVGKSGREAGGCGPMTAL